MTRGRCGSLGLHRTALSSAPPRRFILALLPALPAQKSRLHCRRNPLVALGIGANVAIFALINAMMLRDLPVPHPERLVELFLVRNGAKLPSRIRCFVNSTGASAFFLRVHRLERPLVVQRQSERSARTKPRFLGYRQFLPGTCEKLPVCRPFVGTELEPNLGDTVRSFREEQASVLHHISRILVIAYCANLNAESDRQWFIDA